MAVSFPNNIRKYGVPIIALLVFTIVITYTIYAIENRPVPSVDETSPPRPKVSVITVQAEVHQAQLQGYGEARPHYSVDLTTEVAGRVTSVNPVLETGGKLDTKTVLATLDPIPFNEQVAAAKQALAEAELAVLQEQHEAERARDEWKQAGLDDAAATPLVFRQPQLTAVQARLTRAKAMLKNAERDREFADIKTPFDAIVVERLVSPGQYVQAGDTIAVLHSVDRIDVRVSLPLAQWALLPPQDDLIGQSKVTLTNQTGDRWTGVISHVDRHINPDSRQRSLVVSVYDPLSQPQPLFTGTFLRAELSGVTRDNLLAVPASALSSSGTIWYISDNNRLSRFPADIVFQQNGTLFLQAPQRGEQGEHYQSLTVLTAPLSSYFVGQEVIPNFIVEESRR